MSTQQVDNVLVGGVLIFDRVEISSLDSEGVYEIDIDVTGAGSHFRLADSLTLKGIRVLSGGDPLELEDEQEIMIMVSCSGTSSIVHESLDVTNPTERIRTSDGAGVTVDNRRIQMFWSTAGGFRRWECPEWA